MALAPNVPLLFLAILGLRLTGQGLLSLTASTAMARVFGQGRGKALSLSGLGYPLGEGLLPLLVVLLIHGVGWRFSWGILGALIALLLLPATYSLLADVETHPLACLAGSVFEGRRFLRSDPSRNSRLGHPHDGV
jgi:MFS family permease